MGGDIAVTSELGRGSVFTVTLPLPPADAVEPLPVPADASAPALLVIDRNPITRSLFRTLLSPHVDGIAFAADVQEASVALAQGGVKQVLVDEMTVRATGDHHAALRAIVDAAGEARTVLLWPAAEESERAALLGTGIACLVAKPVSGPSLVATLFRQENDPLVRRAA
jgi:CheY-like chemotaxis protein